MNRRTFLTAASVATAAALPARLHGADGPPDRIPVGFLGASYSHGPDKIRLTRTSPDWEFVGVCDDTPAGRAICEKLGVARITREELFARSRVVAVESEVRDHAAHALAALQAGRHVHVEKPAAANLRELGAMIDLAREKKLLLQSGYMWRYHPGFQALFDAVRQGWLGEVFQVRACMNNHLAADRRSEWAEFAGGSMFEQGSHLIDAIVRLLGRPRRVVPFLRHHGPHPDTLRDNNLVVLEYERALASVTNTCMQAAGPAQRWFEVLGTRGSATLNPVEPGTLVLALAEPAGPHPRGVHTVPLPAYSRYVGDFADFAAAVRGEHSLLVSLEEERRVAETVLLASEME